MVEKVFREVPPGCHPRGRSQGREEAQGPSLLGGRSSSATGELRFSLGTWPEVKDTRVLMVLEEVTGPGGHHWPLLSSGHLCRQDWPSLHPPGGWSLLCCTCRQPPQPCLFHLLLIQPGQRILQEGIHIQPLPWCEPSSSNPALTHSRNRSQPRAAALTPGLLLWLFESSRARPGAPGTPRAVPVTHALITLLLLAPCSAQHRCVRHPR